MNTELLPDPYYNESLATFGDRLCAARELSGLTQAALASRLGVKTKSIIAWENDMSEPRANKLQMVSGFLNVSMVWLMSGLGNGIDPPREIVIEKKNNIADNFLQEIQSIRIEQQLLFQRMSKLEKQFRENLGDKKF